MNQENQEILFNTEEQREATVHSIERVLSQEQLAELQECVDNIFTEFKNILRENPEFQPLYLEWKSNKGNIPDKLHQKIVSWWDAGIRHRIASNHEEDKFIKMRVMIRDGSTDFRLYAYTGIGPTADIFLQSFEMWEYAQK